MTLNIFDADDAPKPRERDSFRDDIVGHIKGGYAIGKRPVASETWVLTTDDPDVAASLAHRFGGEIEELDVERGDDQRIVTTVNSIEILIDSPESMSARMILFGLQGPIHACDGQRFTSGEDKGEPCGCPQSYQDRKALAKSGRGPSPEIRLRLRLADDPDLGYLVYRTSSWGLVADLRRLETELADAADKAAGEPVSALLRLELVEYTTKAGREVRYHRPVIDIRA